MRTTPAPRAASRPLPLYAAAPTVLVSLAVAASPPTVPSRGEVELPEEAVVLSPFLVSEDVAQGYQATSTLAGTRINTSLKDIGAAVSIYTKDFLRDLGANNAGELLIYATAMEAAGPQGNFSGAATDIADPEVVGDAVRRNPQSATRTRGLAAPNFTRGFFNSGIPIDSYNTDGVTVNRGPNAILFGVGSPAGVVDATPVQANLRRPSGLAEFRYGNNDSRRAVLDVNAVLASRKLAFRIIGLDDNERYNQRPAFEHQKRIHAALNAKPFASTALRGSFEAGRTRANRPITVLPFNSVPAEWYAAGQPVYNWPFYDDPALNPNAAAQSAGFDYYGFFLERGNFYDRVSFVYTEPNAMAPTLSWRNNLQHTAGTVANAVRSNLFHPLVNRDVAADRIEHVGTINIGEFAGGFWPDRRVPAGIRNQGFTDFAAFDFKNKMLDETSSQGDSFHGFNVALEQLAWHDRLGVELAYATERVDSRSMNAFLSAAGNNHVRVDGSVTLPTGQPNPNVGRPYMHFGPGAWSNRFTTRDTVRATTFVRYNFKDASPRLGKWLGRHVLTGLVEQYSSDALNYGHRLVTQGDAAESINPNPNVAARRPGIFVYLGDSVLGGRPLSLRPIQIPPVRAGLTVQTPYFYAPAGSRAQGDFVTVPTTLTEINDGGSMTREMIKSQAAVLQSYWAAEHLVTTVGWRRDEDYFVRESIGYNTNPNKVHYGLEDFDLPSTPPPTAAKEVKTYSAVLRWPQKLARLPLGADASVFVNRSENFTPLGARVDVYGHKMPSPVGKTREVGVNVSLLNERLFVRLNQFETSVQGQTFNSPAFSAAYNNAVLQTSGYWAIEQNRNPHLDRSADIELLYSVLPPNFRELHQWRVSGTAAQQNLAWQHTTLPGIADTTDYSAEGYEFEVAFSPTTRWRILANVARQETVQTNIAPNTKEFIARMKPVWDQLGGVPAQAGYPVGYVPGTPLPGNVTTYREYLNSVVYGPFANTIAAEGVASAEQRKWRANFVVNYIFAKESVLRGWSAGAGLRWQDKLGIGYPSSYNPDGTIRIDLQHPYYTPSETNADAWLAYTRKVWNGRVNWKLQLNVRNLIGEDGTIGITVQPWGDIATARLAPERRWYLTNTFSF